MQAEHDPHGEPVRLGRRVATRVSWDDKTKRGVEEVKSGYFNDGVPLNKPEIHMMNLAELAVVEYLEEQSEAFDTGGAT